MDEKSRATRWRNALAAKGGKPVGVTLTPGAAAALESIQFRHGVSQREAISRALEFAAAHMGMEDEADRFMPVGGRDVEPLRIAARLEEMARRLDVIESRLGGLKPDEAQPGLEPESNAGSPLHPFDTAITGEAAERLVDFSARHMWEMGERVARSRLYDLARQEGVPIHDTVHGYTAFVSLNMDRIRERMRVIK